MTLNDASALLSFLLSKNITEKEPRRDLLNVVGGNSALMYRFIDYSIRYSLSLDETVKYLLGHVIEDVKRKLIMFKKNILKERRIEIWRSIEDLFRKLCREPVEYKDIDLNIMEYVDWFVGWNILQYGCREYIGIYMWNQEKSGGLCSLDVIAPSNRLYHKAPQKNLPTKNTTKQYLKTQPVYTTSL